MQMDSRFWFLPNPSITNSGVSGLFNVVSKLVALMKQRSSLEELEPSDAVQALVTVMEAVINDSCAYVSTDRNV